MGGDIFANHLKNSLSPYLLQHKDNPVDWYEWGEEAFKKAKKENKLIFLSIGYSTCHWCHVMAKESFSDSEVAKILNRYYISIKVDKEQMPHIDNYYQRAYTIFKKKGGGWPLTVILTPDKKPIFFGTYLPKDAGYGSKGLINILTKFAHTNLDELEKRANSIQKVLQSYQKFKSKSQKIEDKLIKKAIDGFVSSFDFKYFGFSDEPKFPQSPSLDILFDLYQLTKDKKVFSMFNGMLKAMAKGGIYDQIDGGFYRYSVNKTWQIPHFEKMLYTNAQLLPLYEKAYKLTKNPLYKRVIDETVKEMDRRFLYKNVYFSASNADSKNANGQEEEGWFFLVKYSDAYKLLIQNGFDKEDAKRALNYFGIEEDGNFDGELSNPHLTSTKKLKSYKKVKALLKSLRGKKEYPFIDKKINTAWNAMMIKAKFECGYVKSAKDSLEALLKLMYKDGELYHQTLLPHNPTQKALLEDFAFLADAVFVAYQTTLDSKYLKLFKKIVQDSLKFYQNGKWRESLDDFISYATVEDKNYQSPLTKNLENILKLSVINGDIKLLSIVKTTISSYAQSINSYPSYYPSALKVALMLKNDIFFVKSSKKNLIDKDFITSFDYPYIYKLVVKESGFLLCGTKSCFSIVKDFKDIKLP
jgi:uncharacterized protein YyaL (SSP411 family)